MRRVILTLLTLSLLHLATVAYVWANDAEQALEPFLSKHCIRCHGPKEQNADRRFDKLSFDFSLGEYSIFKEFLIPFVGYK